MKKLRFLNILAIAILTAGMLAAAVQDASASPGLGPYEPPQGTPEPPKPPGDGDGEGDTGDVGDPSDTKKEGGILTQIFKVVFDTKTMREAIQKAINVIFFDAVEEMSLDSNPVYSLGKEFARIVFRSAELEKIRLSSWLQLRKVAFALLPLTAALTIWASMKDGLYSVTGYANTFEAVAEFFVTIALALASFWLMEKAIGLTASLTDAIAKSLSIPLTKNLYMGMIVKPFGGAISNIVTYMVLNIIAFAINLVYMGSVLIVFLSREVVLLLTVALAPLMLILGSVRPLAWLRGLWAKAFLVFLLLLPVNVLVMGISYKLLGAALTLDDPTQVMTEVNKSVIQLVIMAGTISVMIAINGTLGKMVYGAVMDITKKVGTSLASLGALAGGVVVGAGGMAAAGTAAGGTAASTGGSIAPTTGGGGGLGVTASSLSSAGSVTSTSKLSATIGSVLSSSRNPIARSAGQGLRMGNAVKDHRIQKAMSSPSLPYQSAPLKLDGKPMPGKEEGLSDITDQFATEKQRMSIGEPNYDVLEAKARVGVDTAEAALIAVRQAGGSEVDYIREKGHFHAGNPSVTEAFRDYYRSEGSTFALGEKSKFKAHDISGKFPNRQQWHNRDIAVGHMIVQGEQRHLMAEENKVLEGTADLIRRTSLAVTSRRLSGARSYNDIMQNAAQSGNLNNWINDTLGQSK